MARYRTGIDRAEIECRSEYRPVVTGRAGQVLVVTGRKGASLHKCEAGALIVGNDACGLTWTILIVWNAVLDLAAAGNRHIEIAPVDTQIVPGFSEDLLPGRPAAADGELAIGRMLPVHNLIRRVNDPLTRNIRIDRNVVGLPIRGLDVPCDIGDGAGQHLQIVWKQRREKG